MRGKLHEIEGFGLERAALRRFFNKEQTICLEPGTAEGENNFAEKQWGTEPAETLTL